MKRRATPLRLGLRAMTLALALCALYLAALFGLGVEGLPAALRPETDLFLFEEMSLWTAGVFCAATLGVVGAAAFAAGALIGLGSRLLGQGGVAVRGDRRR